MRGFTRGSIGVGCLFLTLGLAGPARAADGVFDITSYGARSDGTSLCTDAIAKAIAACKAAGGGTVRIPPGVFLSGPIELASNMTFDVEKGATLKFSDDPAQYPIVHSRWEGIMRDGHHPCLWAKDCQNVTISGGGTLDGQGQTWWGPLLSKKKKKHKNALTDATQPEEDSAPIDPQKLRPPLLQVLNSQHVVLQDITLTNSPFWTCHLLFSDDVKVTGCQMLNPKLSPNTDALDIDSSSHVVVENCHAAVGDDAICLKAGKGAEGRQINRPTEYVTVDNCTMEYTHGAMAIGSETAGSIRHIHFFNNRCVGSNVGLRIKSARGRGGVVEDVQADHLQMDNVGTAILLTMHYTKTPQQPVSDATPRFDNIRVSDVTGVHCGTAIEVEGLVERPITDIDLEHINIEANKGITCSYGDNISLNDVTVVAHEAPAMKQDHTTNLNQTDVHTSVTPRVAGDPEPATEPVDQ